MTPSPRLCRAFRQTNRWAAEGCRFLRDVENDKSVREAFGK
jgi:hypothetical protein